MMMAGAKVILIVGVVLLHCTDARAQEFKFGVELSDFPCGQYDDVQAIVWYDRDTRMSIADLAAYCAPVQETSPSGSGTTTETDFVFETGIRFRAGLAHSPFSFMTKVADFWGVRFGVKGNGFFDIDTLRYVVEIGAGTW